MTFRTKWIFLVARNFLGCDISEQKLVPFVIGCVIEITAKNETELRIYSDAVFGYCFGRATNNTENRGN